MLNVMRQVYSRPFTVQVIRSLATSSQLQKRKELSPESDVILLTGQDKSQTSIKYSELLERVGKKNLVKVTKSKVKVDLPMFQLMTDVELEIAMRKEKAHSASYAGVRTSYGNFNFCVLASRVILNLTIAELEGGKLKLKELDLKSRITENDFNYQSTKILKWLERGNFVTVTIKVAKESSREEAENLKKRIEELLTENKDLIQSTSRLSIKL